MVPAIVRLLHARYAGTGAMFHGLENNEAEYGNTVVRLGRAFVRTACLSKHLAHSEVMVVPDLTKRGPNGAWFIRRGPLHPLSRLVAEARYWTAKTDSGIAVTTLVEMDKPGRAGNSEEMIELFLDRAGVESMLERMFEPGTAVETPGLADGEELLAALGCCNRVEYEVEPGHFAVVHRHELLLDDEGGQGFELLNAGLAHATRQSKRHGQLRQQLADLNDSAAISRRHLKAQLNAERSR